MASKSPCSLDLIIRTIDELLRQSIRLSFAVAPFVVSLFQEGAEDDEEDDEDFDAAAAAEEDDDEEGVEEVRGDRDKQSQLVTLFLLRRDYRSPLLIASRRGFFFIIFSVL